MKKGRDSEEFLIRLFGSGSRARILSFLYGHAGRSFYQREIMYETGLSLRPVQRELGNLVALGIVKRQEARNRVYYEVNCGSLLFNPLREILFDQKKENGNHDRKLINRRK